MDNPLQDKVFLAFTNALIRLFIRFGFSGHSMFLVTVKDRETGQSYSAPMNVIEKDGQRWLVPLAGKVDWRGNIQPVDWVSKLRAAGQATLTQGRRKEHVTPVEAQPEESIEVLKAHFTGSYLPFGSADDPSAPSSQEEPFLPFIESNGVPLVSFFALFRKRRFDGEQAYTSTLLEHAWPVCVCTMHSAPFLIVRRLKEIRVSLPPGPFFIITQSRKETLFGRRRSNFRD